MQIPYTYKTGFMLSNGDKIIYKQGSFDQWCVYIKKRDDERFHAPLDKDYFNELYSLALGYGFDNVYSSFKKVYDSVRKCEWTREHKDYCYKICHNVDSSYDEDTLLLWLTYYMTMLAEEMKEGSILGKQIKHLGVYNLLYDRYSIDYITHYMKNKRWTYLRDLLVERDIYESK